MESKIRVLSEQTINQIAAGEVIENAASVIKELVENSIDAGATEISVEISGGGRQLIRVRDNGCGMNEDDALLCLERHATSKLRGVDDLQIISSMGFRGEAIPSIASISKFTLTTAPHGQKGTIVIVDGGKIVKTAPVDCEAGTMIEVKELFFNVPARKKFQKAPAHDTQEILKSLTLIALGHPSIKFELISNQKTLLNTGSSGELQERISDVLGVEFLQELSPIVAQHQEWQLQGYIGQPACTRHNRTGQFLFINKRAVSSPLISYAVRDGYGPALASNRHPLFVLHLTLPGSLVDVNVHPQKREVRLRHEQALREWIVKTVEGTLPKYENFYPVKEEFSYSAAPLAAAASLEIAERREVLYERAVAPTYTPSLFIEPVKAPKKAVKVLATFPGYIAIERSAQDGLNLIDQRAGHARVIFERLIHAGGSVEVQTLLIPYTLELTPLESSILEAHLEDLNGCGISIKAFGQKSYVIDALPQIFGNADIAAFLHELVSNLREFKGIQEELKKQIAETASRSAVSRSRRLTYDEAQTLVNQLMECDMPFQCPKGKPTLAEIPLTHLTTLFK